MNIEFSTTYNFEKFKSELKDLLSRHTVRKIKTPEYKKAAVLVLLINRDSTPHVVLTERSDMVSTHKGQISFPGGSFDETDSSLLETALRETEEEIGIKSEQIEILGEFDEFFSVSCFHVNVFIGAAECPLDYNEESEEIERILEVPLDIFINGKYSRKEKFSHFGRDFNLYFYDYEGSTIWGMTGRILTDLSRKVLRKINR